MELMEGWMDGADGGMEAQVESMLSWTLISEEDFWKRLKTKDENKDATMSLKKLKTVKTLR